MRLCLLLAVAALGLSACVPRALYFHESTKLAIAADYNTSDSQPLATTFGYKRRIVAVVPAQEREVPSGESERRGTNRGEALSLVSKFSVQAGTAGGVTIINNFASGEAAHIMTQSAQSPAALNALMHSAPIRVSALSGTTARGVPATQAVNERVAQIMSKRFHAPSGGTSRGRIDKPPDGDTSRGRIDTVPGAPTLSEPPPDSGASRGTINSPSDVGNVAPKPATSPPPRP